MTSLVLGFPEYRQQGKRVAIELGVEFAEVDIHHFPDGESRVRLPEQLPETVIFCRSLNAPNDKLIELFIAAATARELGAKQLVLVAPYLCYMRQDKSFVPGEGVSQRIVGTMLAEWFDALITVDPHLHRIRDLGEAIPLEKTFALSAAPALSAFLARHIDSPFLIGPDAESEQWVEVIAASLGCDYVIAGKRRFGDTDVRVSLPPANYQGKQIVIIDDMISTGKTLEAVVASIPHAANSISVLATHALFGESTAARLEKAGVRAIWTTDTVPHDSNAVEVAPLLADVIRQLM